MAVAAGLAGWLTLVAGPDAARPVAAIGVAAVVAVCGAVVLGKPEPLVVALALLGGAYAVILAIDAATPRRPRGDRRRALAGRRRARLPLARSPGSAVTDEAGTLARRIAGVMTLALLALAAGATVLIVVDVFRTGGIVVEAVGVAAAATAVGLLVLAARGARGGSGA